MVRRTFCVWQPEKRISGAPEGRDLAGRANLCGRLRALSSTAMHPNIPSSRWLECSRPARASSSRRQSSRKACSAGRWYRTTAAPPAKRLELGFGFTLAGPGAGACVASAARWVEGRQPIPVLAAYADAALGAMWRNARRPCSSIKRCANKAARASWNPSPARWVPGRPVEPRAVRRRLPRVRPR